MSPLVPDPEQAQQWGPNAEKDAPRDPHLPWQPGKAAPSYRKQATGHKRQSPAPAAALPGPQPAGEGGPGPQAGPGHHRAGGEGQEDNGMEVVVVGGTGVGPHPPELLHKDSICCYDFIPLCSRTWSEKWSYAKPRSAGSSSLSNERSQRP